VANSIESQAQGQPALVLGHSLGAMTSYLAAHHYPHLFKALVMLDPPLLNGLPAYTFHVARYFGLDGNMTPAKRSQSRREIWTSREEAALALRPKALFKAFDADCFADYINYGFTECEEGVKLTIPVATEVAIFKTAPSNSWRYWRKLKVPAALVVGKQSHFAQTGCPERLARWQPVSLQYIEGGHMFPLRKSLRNSRLGQTVI
jgi:pimeloyl-ACP methyl ester carboxylesterase